ncbi:MAG: protein of unknown function DUF58 [uncultured bacterium]|nr:MAG: protein of unknown function DUF58 [uncultured bacterium]
MKYYRIYALYRFTERIKQWFSARFTSVGKLFLLMAGVALLFGIDVQRTMMYQILGIAASLLIFSFLSSLRFRTNLKITRNLPETCVAGSELRYTIQIDNRGRKNEKAILFRENPTEPLPTWQEFNSSKEEGEEKRNIFDRKMGYYRWLWLLRLGRRIESCDQELPELVSSKKKEVEISLLPLKRGNVHLRGFILTSIDPFGLCKRQVHYESPQNLLVLPKLYPVPKLFFPGSRKYHQGGIIAAQNRGESNEFLSLREYSHGDPIKHIDWKSTARAGRTIVKQYRDEYFSRYGLILDSFTAKPYSNAFEEAVSVAASIMMTQDSENSVLDLLFVGRECVTCTVGRGLADRQRMMEILASVTTCRDKPFAEMTGFVKSRSELLSGIILILIDLDEDRNDLINYLAGNRIPVKLIMIVEDQEEYAAKKQKIQAAADISEIDLNHLEEQLALL